METDLFGIPDSPDTTKNAATEAAKATRKTAPKDQASPLAERLRPKTIDEVVGQKHLLGPGKPLRSAFENAHPHSMILWGPPGVGKTTLARLMADAFGLPFISISAVLGGVKDIRDAVEKATANREKNGRSTVVFVDEVPAGCFPASCRERTLYFHRSNYRKSKLRSDFSALVPFDGLCA